MLPALEAVELEAEPNSVDESGFTIVVRGRVMRVSFYDLGHYLDPIERTDLADSN